MNTIISSLEHITRSKECRVVFTKRGNHIFGGEIENLVVNGPDTPAHIHHIFTIDTSDDLTPIRFSDCRFLPLIFPLAYEDASYLSYMVTGELEIEVISYGGCSLEDPDYFPGHLPLKKAHLKPLSYAEKRIYYSDIREKSFFDKRRLERLWNGQFFGISGMLEYNNTFGPCLDKESSDNTRCSSWKFAKFPATEIPFGDIWNDIPSDAVLEFFLCMNCSQIHANLNCT